MSSKREAGPKMVRQGDVLLRPVPGIPEGAEPLTREGGRVVLAFGEATGHAHAIAEPGAMLYEWPGPQSGAGRYLQVDVPVLLGHEEHTAIEVEPGFYEVIQQQVWTPRGVRYVQD